MSTTGDWIQPFIGKNQLLLGRSLRRFIKSHYEGEAAAKGSLASLGSRDNDYYGFKYRFEPKSVDPSKPSTLEHHAGEEKYGLRRPTEHGGHVLFEGLQRLSKQFDLVILYDEQTHIYTLEKLDSQFDFKYIASTSGPSSAQPVVAAVTKPSPATVSSQPTPEDRALEAELEAALIDDVDADGEADDDFELEEVHPAAVPQAPATTSYASYADEEDFSLSAQPPAPGKGKGVARANEAAANGKKGKPKAKAAAPRGKKRGRVQDDDDDFEPVAIPALPPAPTRATKRRKSSPAPAPAPVHAAPAPPRPQELLVPPPVRAEPHYTSSEDEGEELEEVIPEVNGIDVQPDYEHEEVVDEYDLFEDALNAVIPEGDDGDAEMEGEIFGELEEEYQEGEDLDSHVNGYAQNGAPTNEYTNGNGAATTYSAYDDTSSDDSDDDDDD